jgi:hypothetical protein
MATTSRYLSTTRTDLVQTRPDQGASDEPIRTRPLALVASVNTLAQSSGLRRRVFVTITDKSGRTLDNVTARDLIVSEGRKPQVVESIAPVSAPMQLALVIDAELAGFASVQ